MYTKVDIPDNQVDYPFFSVYGHKYFPEFEYPCWLRNADKLKGQI